jgi:hypothetical protein
MNKKFVAIMLGVVVFAVAGCTADKTKTDIGTPLTVERNEPSAPSTPVVETPTTSAPVVEAPTTTTTDNTAALNKAALASKCSNAMDSIQEGLNALSEGSSSLPYVSKSEALSFIATAKEFISTSIGVVQRCAEFAPAEAKTFINSLRAVGTALDQAASMLSAS